MSTPTPRRPARCTSSTPSTPNTAVDTVSRTDSAFHIAPKSEYLRHALDASRAKQAPPTPAPAETITPQSEVLKRAPSDPWLDQAQTGLAIPQSVPTRRPRRPSEGTMPRMRTQRELQAEFEAAKDQIFDLNMKLELVRKQNNDLKDEVEAANQRIAELEPLEDDNIELREENDRLKLKMQEVNDDLLQQEDLNKEILQIQDETVAEMEKRQAALAEAADYIVQMENEKAALAQENTELKEQITNLESQIANAYSASNESATMRAPSRVHSIDESRPSTSHFDSDYYSQPASPQVRPSKESIRSGTFSERARTFLDLKESAQQSIQDLKKRASDVSIKRVKARSSVPEVPQIPDQYQSGQQALKNIKRTPKRIKPFTSVVTQLNDPDAASNLSPSAYRSPTTREGLHEGLRSMFREKMTLETSPHNVRPSSSQAHSPLAGRGSHNGSRSSLVTPPIRGSSRHAYTSSSNEQLRKDSASEPKMDTETEGSEWVERPPPSSVMSDDQTTEVDFDRLRDKWWRDTQNYKGIARDFSLTTGRKASGTPYVQKDFLFNPAEDEDQFAQRVRSSKPSRR